MARRLKHVWSNSNKTAQAKNDESQIRKQHVSKFWWASMVCMRAPNMFGTAVQTKKTSRTKVMFFCCLIECLMAFKFYQTPSKSTKQGGQTVKCLVTKQCLIVFGCQTFPVWAGLNKATIVLFAWELPRKALYSGQSWQWPIAINWSKEIYPWWVFE